MALMEDRANFLHSFEVEHQQDEWARKKQMYCEFKCNLVLTGKKTNQGQKNGEFGCNVMQH